MKISIPLLIVLCIFIFTVCIFIFTAGIITGHILAKNAKENEIQFIWNDDEESIPVDGSLIRLEFTDENNVYIGPAE